MTNGLSNYQTNLVNKVIEEFRIANQKEIKVNENLNKFDSFINESLLKEQQVKDFYDDITSNNLMITKLGQAKIESVKAQIKKIIEPYNLVVMDANNVSGSFYFGFDEKYRSYISLAFILERDINNDKIIHYFEPNVVKRLPTDRGMQKYSNFIIGENNNGFTNLDDISNSPEFFDMFKNFIKEHSGKIKRR